MSLRLNQQVALRASCDECRKAKVRCRPEGSSCSRCKKREWKCEFSPVRRKRSVKGQHAPPHETINEMKARLERMESLLLARRLSSAGANNGSSRLLDDHENDVSFCLTDGSGFSCFIGSVSGLGILSPRGLQWVSNVTGSTTLLEFVSTNVRTYVLGWSEEMSTWQNSRPDDRTPFPPKGSAMLAVNYFFAYVNSILPLFDKRGFMNLLNAQYSDDPPTSVAWYASFNAVLGIGALAVEDEVGVPPAYLHPTQNTEGRDYLLSRLRNCYSVFTQLSFSCREVMGVQALVAMAMILEFMMDVEAAYMVIGSAARLALGIGLNQDCKDAFSPSEVEERRRIFWVAYVLDHNMSFRLGRPPTISDDDIQVSEPPTGMFSHMVKLIRIESEIYTMMYSARSRGPDWRTKRLGAEDELYKKLVAWQHSLPDGDLWPGQVLQCPNPMQLPSTVALHAEYYNCKIMLWRLSSNAESSSLPADSRPSPKRIECLAAARDTIKLLDSLGEGEELIRNNLWRRLSYYPLSAFLVLFVNLLQYPRDPSAMGDLDMLRVTVNSMSGPLTRCRSPFALLVFEFLRTLMEIAEDFFARTLGNETKWDNPAKHTHNLKIHKP